MRLIDADKILDALSIFTDKENGNKHFMYGIETAKELIEDALEEREKNMNINTPIKPSFDMWIECPRCGYDPDFWEVGEFLRDGTWVGPYRCPICGQLLDLSELNVEGKMEVKKHEEGGITDCANK